MKSIIITFSIAIAAAISTPCFAGPDYWRDGVSTGGEIAGEAAGRAICRGNRICAKVGGAIGGAAAGEAYDHWQGSPKTGSPGRQEPSNYGGYDPEWQKPCSHGCPDER